MARSNHISAIIAPIERLRDTSFGAKIRYIYSFFPLFFEIHKFSLLKKQWYYLIMSKGWPGSVPLSLAGKILWMQLAIHESDTVPGKANGFLGKIADIILLWYDDASKYFPGMNALVIGQILDPVWYKHTELSSNITWKTDLRHILVICGSQGSRAILKSSHTLSALLMQNSKLFLARLTKIWKLYLINILMLRLLIGLRVKIYYASYKIQIWSWHDDLQRLSPSSQHRQLISLLSHFRMRWIIINIIMLSTTSDLVILSFFKAIFHCSLKR